MDELNQFDLMLEAMTEIIREEKANKESPQTQPMPALPSLRKVLADISPLPREALFLGMANDGLPILLNLFDPVPGPILIAGDSSSGKTKLLQIIARAAEFLHSSDAVQYGIITAKPDEWKDLYGSENNAGVYFSQEENAGELLQSLVTWAHRNKGEQQSILLLIDGLESITKLDEQVQQNLRWLLLRGPSRRVWPFITLNADQVEAQKEWLEFFHTRLFGHIDEEKHVQALTGEGSLDHLNKGTEFAIREGDKLLTFWLPSLN